MADPHKTCFGVLDDVFPIGTEGLREVVPSCFDCPVKLPCLQEALKTENGIQLRHEILDRSKAEGLVNRLKRWAEKKDLNRRLRQQQGKKK